MVISIKVPNAGVAVAVILEQDRVPGLRVLRGRKAQACLLARDAIVDDCMQGCKRVFESITTALSRGHLAFTLQVWYLPYKELGDESMAQVGKKYV